MVGKALITPCCL